jgi:hypothetical protein
MRRYGVDMLVSTEPCNPARAATRTRQDNDVQQVVGECRPSVLGGKIWVISAPLTKTIKLADHESHNPTIPIQGYGTASHVNRSALEQVSLTCSLLLYPSNLTAHSSRWPLAPGRATLPDCTTTRRSVLNGFTAALCRAAAALGGTIPLRAGKACSHNLQASKYMAHTVGTGLW